LPEPGARITLALSDGGEIFHHVASGLKPLPPLKFTDEAVHALTLRSLIDPPKRT